MQEIINWLESHQFSCLYKKFLGIPCPGCGIQSSFIFLLKGEFLNSFLSFPLLIPIIALILFSISHLIYKFTNGAKIIKISFIFVGILLSILYIYNIIKLNYYG